MCLSIIHTRALKFINSVKQQQLFNVLVAYSMYNTEVGYCQGMSEIAALLLMFMSEEVRFTLLLPGNFELHINTALIIHEQPRPPTRPSPAPLP